MTERTNPNETGTDIDLYGLRQAITLFRKGRDFDVLCTSLEGLGAELGCLVKSHPPQDEWFSRIQDMADAIDYCSKRFLDVLVRLKQIEWMKRALAYSTKADVFAQADDQEAASWRLYMGLAVKDFHVDVASLMDSLAPVVILAGSRQHPVALKKRLPGWSTIQRDGKHRKQLSDEMAVIVDDTDRWWQNTKVVRDHVTHRDHNRIVFGNSEDGLLFQVYDGLRNPMILPRKVLYPKAHNVVDFGLYSAFVISKVVLLFHHLGPLAASSVGIFRKDIDQMCFRGVDKSVVESIERLVN